MFITGLFTFYILSWIFGGGLCYLLSFLRKKKETRAVNAEDILTPVPIISSMCKLCVGNCARGLEKWMMIRVGKVPAHWFRMVFYKYVFQMSVDKDVVIYSHSQFRNPTGISIGKASIIGDNCWVDGRGGVHIGKDCNLSSEVRIWSAQHGTQSPVFCYEEKEVTIGDRAWISSNVIILPGVHIGEGAVIAAGAVVTKDADAYGVYAGIPAKKIGERTSELQYHFDGKHDWFM